MNVSEHQIQEMIRKDEGLDLEFKACRNQTTPMFTKRSAHFSIDMAEPYRIDLAPSTRKILPPTQRTR